MALAPPWFHCAKPSRGAGKMAPEISLPRVVKSKLGAKALKLLKKLNGYE